MLYLLRRNLVPITFGEFIPADKIRKNDSKNMSVLQNDVHSTSRYVNILMDSGVSASITHHLFVRENKFNTSKTTANKWSTMLDLFQRRAKQKLKLNFPN